MQDSAAVFSLSLRSGHIKLQAVFLGENDDDRNWHRRLFWQYCYSSVCTTSHAQEEPETVTFAEFKGKVVDSRGKPIEKFKIEVTVFDYSKGGWYVAPETLKKCEGEFENGEFQFDINETFPAASNKTYITRSVSADGFIDTNRNQSFTQLSTFKGDFGKIKLLRGIKIKGTVKLPDSQSDGELVAAKVYVSKKMSSLMPDYSNAFQKFVKVGEGGVFEAVVPEDCKLLVTTSCDNAAASTQTFTIKKCDGEGDEQDLGDIKLKEGVSVSGVVLDSDGKPVEGQIVHSRQTVQQSSIVYSAVYGNAVTDAEGKFKLPPREGELDITLVKQASIDNKQVKVKGDLIMAKPVKLTLKAGEAVPDIEIRECPTYKVHGVVNFEKSKPNISTSSGSNAQVQIKVKDNGEFEVEVVEGTTPYLMIFDSNGSESKVARLSTSSRKYFSGNTREDSQFFSLKKVTSDIGPLEFTMVPQVIESTTFSEMLYEWYFWDG